jgi:hypothetical protein
VLNNKARGGKLVTPNVRTQNPNPIGRYLPFAVIFKHLSTLLFPLIAFVAF